mgnify:CR=1 FL=1
MTKHVRHIWAKANQHIKVHRPRFRSGNGKNDDVIYLIIAIVIFIWMLQQREMGRSNPPYLLFSRSSYSRFRQLLTIRPLNYEMPAAFFWEK